MSKVDVALALIICVGAYGGFKDGFLVELISFIAVVVGVIVGFRLWGAVHVYLEREIAMDKDAAPYIGFAAILFSVIFLANLFIKLIRPKVEKPILGIVDQSFGAFIALLKTATMLSILLWIYTSMKFYFPDGWAEDSWLLPFLTTLAPDTADWLGKFIPLFEDLFRKP